MPITLWLGREAQIALPAGDLGLTGGKAEPFADPGVAHAYAEEPADQSDDVTEHHAHLVTEGPTPDKPGEASADQVSEDAEDDGPEKLSHGVSGSFCQVADPGIEVGRCQHGYRHCHLGVAETTDLCALHPQVEVVLEGSDSFRCHVEMGDPSGDGVDLDPEGRNPDEWTRSSEVMSKRTRLSAGR